MQTERPHGSTFKVGQLAAAAGVTIRTLHYYEEIGLLPKSERTDAGHRVYSQTDVERLSRVCLLRRLGLPLRDINAALNDEKWNLRSAMATYLRVLDRRLESTASVRARVAQFVDSTVTTSINQADELLNLLEEITMHDATVQRRISILVYSDLEAAFDYLVRVFKLGPGELVRDDTGRVVHGEIQAGDGVVWLHPELQRVGMASPAKLGGTTASMAVMVDDVDAHFKHASEHGATIVHAPIDEPYGFREYSARDSEGGLWSFMKPLD